MEQLNIYCRFKTIIFLSLLFLSFSFCVSPTFSFLPTFISIPSFLLEEWKGRREKERFHSSSSAWNGSIIFSVFEMNQFSSVSQSHSLSFFFRIISLSLSLYFSVSSHLCQTGEWKRVETHLQDSSFVMTLQSGEYLIHFLARIRRKWNSSSSSSSLSFSPLSSLSFSLLSRSLFSLVLSSLFSLPVIFTSSFHLLSNISPSLPIELGIMLWEELWTSSISLCWVCSRKCVSYWVCERWRVKKRIRFSQVSEWVRVRKRGR